MLDRDELNGWLRLTECPGVGPARARELLARFGSPQAIVAAQLLGDAPDGFDELVERTWRWQQAGAAPQPRWLIALGDAHYPPALLEAVDPPLLLYAVGRIELLHAPAVAIVGSRNPTPQGTQNARDFGAALAGAGLTVVSGMALGIDGAAHEGALSHPASTIAVLGTGIDRVYPRRHAALAHRIAADGLLLAECALGAHPLEHHFPRRNRIIAGLGLGTLVVEAALQSGSLITARLAVEAGREVFAMPGSIHNPLARGCHALIRRGAKLVESAQDVLDELRWTPAVPLVEPAVNPAPDDALLAALGHDPLTLDELANRTGVDTATLSARLLDLELDGHVARLPGQRFQRLVRA